MLFRRVKIPLLIYKLAIEHYDHLHAEVWTGVLDVYYSIGCIPVTPYFVLDTAVPDTERLAGLYPFRAPITRKLLQALAARGYIRKPNGNMFHRMPDEFEEYRFIPYLFTEELQNVLH